MKSAKWVLIAAALLFVGYIVFGTVASPAVTCEVCLRFEGESVCRKGGGATEEEAMRAAQESTCGGNARGMSESIACRNREPERAVCTND